MTSTLVVDGGAPLVGDIEVRGAKNLVSKAMVAVVLAEEPCRLRGVPEISDVQVVSGLPPSTTRVEVMGPAKHRRRATATAEPSPPRGVA